MDYKEKYEKTLEVIKEILGSGEDTIKTSRLQSSLKVIFPELEENEDERIRKALIEYFGEQCDMSDWNGVYGYQVLAWLEKQSQEPKKVSIWKHWKDGIAGNGEGEDIYLIKIGNKYKLSSCLSFECDYIELSNLDNLMFEKPQCKKSEINKSEANTECIGESITAKLEKAIKMKLEEAIKHCEEVALSCDKDNKECAIEHIQLMQWLKELRVLRQLVKPEYLQEIRGLQKTWGKEWEEYFNRALCYDVTGPFRELNKFK